MKINYNVSAMVANSTLNTNDNALSKSIERLSSGLKINHAKDNASGLAMAKRMNAQLRGVKSATENSNDGISVIEIAEGALSEIHDMIQRMNELAVKASNGTLSDDDRKIINDEIDQLRDEVERISATTMYNGQVLLDGSYDLRGYTQDANVKVETYSDGVRAGHYNISSIQVDYDEATNEITSATLALGSDFPAGATYSFSKDSIFITDGRSFDMEFKITGDVSDTDLDIYATGLGAMNMQIGSNEGQELEVRIPKVSLRAMGIAKEDTNVLTQDNALEFLGQMDRALQYISDTRSRLGAYQNRLEHTVSSLDVTYENMTGAYSRIMDVDMAEEMTEYSKNQVLVQAGTSMLAQANERPSQVLQLLQ